MQGFLGITVILMICWGFSEKRKAVKIVPLLKGLVLQILLAFLILKVPPVHSFFQSLGAGVNALRLATIEGTSFVFGYLGGGPAPFSITDPSKFFVFAFQALPLLMVVSALSFLLFHWNILPIIVRGLSWFFRKTLDLGAALGLFSGAKIFLGQTECPILIRPYLKSLSRGEIFTVMVLGFATTSGTLWAIYASILGTTVPDVLTHIVTASIINIPAAILLSRLLIPHEIADSAQKEMAKPYEFSGPIDAIARGTSDGLQLFLNVAAILIVFIALVALVNQILGCLPMVSGAPLTLQRMLSTVFAPFTWLMGVPWNETPVAGGLLGIKTVLNEICAYVELAQVQVGVLGDTSKVILTYALCGFANVASIGLLVGCLGTMEPGQRSVILQLGWKALLVGTLASCLSGTVVGLILNLFPS